MNEEVLAAAAVYLYSAYNNFLEAHLNTRSKAIQKYRMMKNKQLKRNCWLPSSRNRTRKRKKPPVQELPSEPRGEFSNLIPISNIDFEYILEEITPIVEHKDVSDPESMPAKDKLALTLKYLATGDCYESLSSQFGVPITRISRVIPEVCSAINDLLRDLIKLPANEDEWLSKAEGFRFPHCIGALDKKQISLNPPSTEDEEDCKGTFSIDLFTLVDSDFCFTYAEVGPQDQKDENLLQKINSGALELPPSKKLADSEISTPYVFLGDEIFPLSQQIMVPFTGKHEDKSPEAIFNEHLAQSRVVVENAFGVMSSIFKVFRIPIQLDPERASIVITTCILLHNFLRKSNSSRHIYSPPESVDMYANNQLIQPGSWRNNYQNNFIPYQSLLCKMEDDSGIQTRIDFMNYLYEKLPESK